MALPIALLMLVLIFASVVAASAAARGGRARDRRRRRWDAVPRPLHRRLAVRDQRRHAHRPRRRDRLLAVHRQPLPRRARGRRNRARRRSRSRWRRPVARSRSPESPSPSDSPRCCSSRARSSPRWAPRARSSSRSRSSTASRSCPALLAVLGPRVDRLRLPFLGRRRPEGTGAWHAMAMWVMKRPLIVLVPALVVLVLAGTPFLQLAPGQRRRRRAAAFEHRSSGLRHLAAATFRVRTRPRSPGRLLPGRQPAHGRSRRCDLRPQPPPGGTAERRYACRASSTSTRASRAPTTSGLYSGPTDQLPADAAAGAARSAPARTSC